MKRLVDIIIAFIALVLLSPIFILVAHKVRKNLGSPIFFLQERPGKEGKIFKMIKFRSMLDAVDKNGNPVLPTIFKQITIDQDGHVLALLD